MHAHTTTDKADFGGVESRDHKGIMTPAEVSDFQLWLDLSSIFYRQCKGGHTMNTTDTKKSVNDIITDLIISKLEAGVIPWRKPWNGSAQAPKNLITGKPYRGVNAFLLACTGHSSPYFATFKQIEEKGGREKKGAKSIPVVFYAIKEVEDRETGDEKNIPVLRYYRVFNLDDVDGIQTPAIEETTREFSPIETAEQIVDGMPQRPEIKTGEARAYYSPSLDYVNMPRKELFHSDEEYYSVLLGSPQKTEKIVR